MRGLTVSLLALGLTGCSFFSQSEGVGVSDTALLYRADLDRGEDRRDFTVRVQNKGAGVAEVRESVRFQATRYCLDRFGGSDALWEIDPVTGDWAFQQDGAVLIFSGRCVAR